VARTESSVAFHRDRWDLAFERYAGADDAGGAAYDPALTGLWPAAVWTSAGHPHRALEHLDAWGASVRRRGWQGYVLLLEAMLRTRVLLDAGRLEEAHAAGSTVLDREDVGLSGATLDCLVVHSLVRAALHTGRTDVVRAHADDVDRMVATRPARCGAPGCG
jgi:hypothetical protein